jgi:hypothetical protein
MTGPFGKEIAGEYRWMKDLVGRRPLKEAGKPVAESSIDPQVREQIYADLDNLIKKNDG